MIGSPTLQGVLGHELEEVDHELRLPGELRAQLGVLRRHSDRAGVKMAYPHHDAATDHQRSGREAELLCPEQRTHDHVTTRLQLTVDLHHDQISEAIQ